MSALVWDFYRLVDNASNTGAVVHYYDEMSQSIYIDDNKLETQYTSVPQGNWEKSLLSDPQYISTNPYQASNFDHPVNGVLHGVAIDGNNLWYLRYTYAMDVSPLVKTGTWRMQSDNPIQQVQLSLQNVSEAAFASLTSLFNPGAKIVVGFSMGDSDPNQIGTGFMDEMSYDVKSDSVSISGRNAIGYKLSTQTFDDVTVINDEARNVVSKILDMAGIENYIIQPSAHVRKHEFESNQSLLSGLEQIFEYYYGWQMNELADGTIIVGYPWFQYEYQANSAYKFNGASDVLARKTVKRADAAYTKVIVTGTAPDENTPAPTITLPVPHYTYWMLGAHKTAHIQAPEGLVGAELNNYAQDIANELQYVGITEQFTATLKPQLLCRDVAHVYYGKESDAVFLGLITSITHNFGATGFKTTFSVDSGGIYTEGDNYIVSHIAPLSGFNRGQNLIDLMGVVSRNNIFAKGK